MFTLLYLCSDFLVFKSNVVASFHLCDSFKSQIVYFKIHMEKKNGTNTLWTDSVLSWACTWVKDKMGFQAIKTMKV